MTWDWGATPCMPSSWHFQEQENYRKCDLTVAKTGWKGWNSPRENWYNVKNELQRGKRYRNCWGTMLWCDLEEYSGDTLEDHIENPIDAWRDKRRYLNWWRDITLVTKHVNEVNEVLRGIPIRHLSEPKYVAKSIALLVCARVSAKIDHIIAILRKDLSRIDDWFKRRWKNGTAKLKCEKLKALALSSRNLSRVFLVKH